MKTTTLLLAVLLTGCVSVPVSPKFPEAPTQLMEPPADLVALQANAQLSDLLDNVTVNYGTYYQQRELLVGWQEWYIKQKQIFNKIDN